MGKKSRERREGEVASTGGGGGLSWLPIVLAAGALVMGFVAWTDTKKIKDDLVKRLADVDQRVAALQTQIANAAKANKPQQGPDPNTVYKVKVDGSPYKGNATAPIVIAEFSDYQ
jgi:protein-disulfide isomerase